MYHYSIITFMYKYIHVQRYIKKLPSSLFFILFYTLDAI